MIGTVIGNCKIEAPIGSGGMGDVYKGTHLSLGVPVAIKLIKPEFAADKDLIERFIREAQLAARLRHPNLVRVYDVGSMGSYHYLLMEYLKGPTLENLLIKHAPLLPMALLKLMLPLSSALSEVHKAGIVHRDIKPENVIIVNGTKPVLMDFGIAGLLTSESTLTQPGHLLGTPAYMAPEQARGESQIDDRADIFAMGVMMYEAMTGRLPQNSSNILEQIRRRAAEPFPPVASFNADIPTSIARLIDTAVEVDMERRWQSGQELSNALADAYRQISSAETTDQSTKDNRPAFTRRIKLPKEGTTIITDGVDLVYSDLFSLLHSVEQSQTGFGMIQLHYADFSDLLLFSSGTLRLAYRWMTDDLREIVLDEVLDQYEASERGIIDAFVLSELYYRSLKTIVTIQPQSSHSP